MSRGRAAALAVVVVLLAVLAYYFGLRGPSGGASPAATTATPITTSPGSPAPSPSQLQLAEEVIEDSNLTLSYGAGYSPVDMSSLWSNLTLANSSSPTISKYIDWLQGALSPGNDSLYNFTYGSVGVSLPQPPQPGVPVRYGTFNLPFGAQVVVLAYPSSSGLVVVLDGRIANQTAWLEALARVSTAVQAPGIGYSPGIDWVNDVAPFYTYLNASFYEWRAPLYTSYTLWRVELDTGAGALYGHDWIPVTVVVLLEEPIYTYNTTQVSMGSLWSAADLAFWDIVGAPTFALAVNIEYAGDPMPQVLYDAVPTILWHTLSISYSFGPDGHPLQRNDYTPFAIQFVGAGICSDQSYATAAFMADALGAASATVSSAYYDHEVSLLVYPPQFAQDVPWPEEINLTKYNATGIVIDNTDPQITPQMMQQHITWVSPSGGTNVFYPFADSTVVGFVPMNQSEANAMLYTGIPEALYQELPPLFQFPWTKYYVQGFNLTYMGQQYEEQFAQMVRANTNLTGTRLYGFYIPSNISEWTVEDYYQFALNGLYQELELGNGIVQAPSLSYLP